MKRISSFLFSLLLLQMTFAQAPEKLSYQSVIRNSSNQLVANQSVAIKISLLQGTASGTPVYVETQTATSNANGLVSVEIGGGTVVSGSVSTINWSAGPYFIKTETDPAGGSNYSIIGTSQLLSVPFALYAKTSGNITPGPTGSQGLVGATGQPGVAGATGATGPSGAPGSTGADGLPGLTGATGPSGAPGVAGTTGLPGLVGPTGPSGLPGQAGATGTTGLVGDQGSIGATGPTGPIALQDGTNFGNTTYWNGTTWVNNSNNLYNNGNTIGIYETNPQYPLHISWNGNNINSGETVGMYAYVEAQNPAGSFLNACIKTNLNTNVASGRSITAAAFGSNFGIGVVGESDTRALSYGLAGYATSALGDNNQKRGVFGWARGPWDGSASGTGAHYGVVGISDAQTTGNNNTGLYGYAVNNNVYGNFSIDGTSDSQINDSYGTTGWAYGINNNYGIYGYATGGAINYAGYFDGNVHIVGTLTNPSDKRLKKNIRPLKSMTKGLIELPVYQYEYEKIEGLNLPEGKQFGFLAQDVEAVYPELVREEVSPKFRMIKKIGEDGSPIVIKEKIGEERYKAVNYIGLIPVLTQTIQEQAAAMSKMEAELELLQAKLKAIEKQIDAVSKK